MRYGCWLIDNIKFSGNDFSKKVMFEDKEIDILITNFQNSKNIQEPFNDWIHNKIIRHGMLNMVNSPMPLNSIFILTLNGYESENSYNFTNLFKLCLKLVYYQPSFVSDTAEYIPEAVITIPNWQGFRQSHTISKLEINSKTFDKVLYYFQILNNLEIRHSHILEEIYKISGIDDVLLELLSLYSFIEGFWWNKKGKSNLTTSFLAMLGQDYAPGKENKDKREIIKSTIQAQNGLLRNPKLDDMRHILAHGMYKHEESSWNKDQWNAIYEQRNLLFELVIESIINRIKNVA
ncbi:hypothetical protein APS56_14220 [Pseudalgibacter alginicilyticus]|uniref:Apea-like HEPN domain-containing protein n=1 Tax=Pseudalgibacter alginicilyticus TaxID=1736674 RepID=A0A0P0DBC2_9FLAO|nr:hypothetical protein [Pseudalgibacter alginicilyticus]ALJ06218.1 hypothetical protein APS56_14220 [Pseudalgibacter alginicilyticus]